MKSNRLKVAMLVLVFTLALAAAASFAAAATGTAKSGQIIATNDPSSDTPVLQFSAGQTIYLKYSIGPDRFGHPGTATITVLKDNDDGTTTPTSYSWSGLTGTGTKTITLTPGYYEADLNGVRVNIAVASIFVVPEAAVGALAALSVCLLAFGTLKIKYKKF